MIFIRIGPVDSVESGFLGRYPMSRDVLDRAGRVGDWSQDGE